ncbi:hypothetical protein CYY_002904 [Polysphondylium violaceum]|uniref:tryptophan--tRNA ligase n=1 Tax=Polysphondylium violaceum TaxID=133409 RepID=A0A8J4PXS1_9MYCE|nr:hypothetical protein CYY_002904 [Polysphondylium violaceum]
MIHILYNNSRNKIKKCLNYYNKYYTTTTSPITPTSTINNNSTNNTEANFILTSLDEIDFKKNVRVFSGMQPTSDALHLGNYLGAMQNWLKLQDMICKENETVQNERDKHSVLFSIVDLHSLTSTKSISPKTLRSNIESVATNYLACGIDPDKVILFNQSMVPAHSELTWIFNCITSIGKLNNMIQFKEKKRSEDNDNISCGLLSYPVLMAADILLYRTTHVPVGEDQRQHLELTRKIAQIFHNQYKTKIFPTPITLNPVHSKKIMSLNDGTCKMSKSDPSEFSRIMLTDTDAQIKSKIKKAKTDTITGISFDPSTRPDVANLLVIASSMSGQPIADIVNEFSNKPTSVFKEFVSDSVISHVSPIREKIDYYKAHPKKVQEVLYKGAEKANIIANGNLKKIKDLVGLYH